MTGRRWQQGESCPAGFQRHHLIPVALTRRAQFAPLFAALERDGLRLGRFPENGLQLPSREPDAAALGHALHRGPHPAYTDVVAARLDAIRRSALVTTAADRQATVDRIRTLQRALRRALTDRHRHKLWLNRRDPMRLFADCAYLDSAIDALFRDPSEMADLGL
jgi:A nuclease family of the HNH/ENDO VII superfamily with conserved AHH